MASPQKQQPPASEEERHLAQLAAAGAFGGPAGEAEAEAARRAVQHDLDQHFVSAGAQMEGERQRSGGLGELRNSSVVLWTAPGLQCCQPCAHSVLLRWSAGCAAQLLNKMYRLQVTCRLPSSARLLKAWQTCQVRRATSLLGSMTGGSALRLHHLAPLLSPP